MKQHRNAEALTILVGLLPRIPFGQRFEAIHSLIFELMEDIYSMRPVRASFDAQDEAHILTFEPKCLNEDSSKESFGGNQALMPIQSIMPVTKRQMSVKRVVVDETNRHSAGNSTSQVVRKQLVRGKRLKFSSSAPHKSPIPLHDSDLEAVFPHKLDH